MPLLLARLYEEDIQFQASMPTSYRISPMSKVQKRIELPESEKQIENLQQSFEYRNKAQRTSSLQKQIEQLSLQREFKLQFEEEFKHQTEPAAKAKQKDVEKCMWQRNKNQILQNFKDFELLNIIGKGTFGKIYLVQSKSLKTLHAMKCIRKDIVIEHESIENLIVEKIIQLQVNHPFIIGIDFVFQKAYRIYFVMDFMQGGELFKHLSEQRRF